MNTLKRLNRVLLVFLLIGHQSFSYAQDYFGYYGKKNFIEVSGLGNVAILQNIFIRARGIKVKDDELVESLNWFNHGARVSAGRAINRRLAISLEVGFDHYQLYQDRYYGMAPLSAPSSGFLLVTRHEDMTARSIRVMPKIEISGPNGLLPIGFVHQIGLGYASTKLVEKDYAIEYSVVSQEQGAAYSAKDFYDFEARYSGIQLLYGFKLRTPITKSLLLSSGIRYQADIMLSPTINDVSQQMFKHMLYNGISLELGLTLVL